MLWIFWTSLIALVYIYIGYPVLVFLLERFFGKKAKIPAEPDFFPFVSLFIPAYNEEKVIREKIENSLKLDYPDNKLEIVIASDGSTDLTNSILAEYNEKIKSVIYQKRSGKTALINRIVPNLKGEIVVFSDSSSILKTDSIKKMIRNYEDEKIGGVSATYKLQTEDESVRARGEGLYGKYETFLKRKESSLHSILGAHGSLYSIRKRLFIPLPENSINDDYIIPMKIVEKGYRVIYEPEAVSYERESTSVKGEMRRRSRISFGNFQQIIILRSLLEPVKGFISFEFFSHKLLRSFSFVFMIALLISSLLIKTNNMRLFLLGEIIFYFLGLTGYVFSIAKIRSKLTTIPFYLCVINLSALVGFLKFIFDKQKVTWERA